MNKHFAAWLWRQKNPGVMAAYAEIKSYEGRYQEMVALYFEQLLRHVKETVPYYKDISLVGVDQIASLPIMTKEIIRAVPDRLVSSAKGRYRYWQNTSGGSTGEPVRLLQDEEYQRWVGASIHYYFKDLVGCDWSASRKLDIWGSVDDFEKNTISLSARLRNQLSNTVFVNAFRFGEETMYQTIQKINQHRPEILKGYSNSLYDLACFIEKNGLKVHSPKVISTRTAMVYLEQRETMERVFGGKVFDFYGSRESSAIAGEGSKQSGRVILEFNNIVEVVDGEILLTNLHNYTMPLIRYKIMDQADHVERQEGFLPTLHGLNGRVFDYFLIDDKNRVHVQYVITLFFFIEGLVSFQIIQHDFTNYTINYIPQKDKDILESKKQEIVERMKKALRSDISVLWQPQTEIEKTPSGKHFYARCEIGK